MRFMMLIKSDDRAEAGELPSPELLTAMGKYNEELVRSGVLLAGEGLQASSKGFRVRNEGGKITVTDGPFAEARELIAGYWMIQAKSKEEAVEWARRVPFAVDGPSAMPGGEGEIEVRQVTEVSDFAPQDSDEAWRAQQAEMRGGTEDGLPLVVKQPPSAAKSGPKQRYMMMFKADAKSEAGLPPTPQVMAEMGALMGEMAQAGVLLSGEGLRPSSLGARVIFSGAKPRVIDGPFAETKELIAGFCLVDVASKAEAVEWATRGALVNGDCVSEVRRVFTEADFGALVDEAPEVFAAEREFRAKTEG